MELRLLTMVFTFNHFILEAVEVCLSIWQFRPTVCLL